MARVKRGVTAHARHKKVLGLAKGYRGRGGTVYRIAIEKVEKALRYAYRDRRNKKRDFRGLWIQRINAAARERLRACLAATTSTKEPKMPKLKTKSGAKKRFDRTATGKIKRNWGHKRHRLISKSKAQKRLHRGTTTLEKGDAKLVLTYMPYLRG